VTTSPALHKAIVCVDIEGFTDPRIADWQRAKMRQGLYGSLERAFLNAKIPWAECYHEDRGDGALFLVHPDVPKARLVERLPFELAAQLGRHNRAPEGEIGIRLRVAMHAGEVRVEQNGVVGTPVNLAFRLLNAPELKTALRSAPGDVALIASTGFYRDVIRHRRAIDQSAYREVDVTVKDTRVKAWICVSDAQLRAGQEYGRQVPDIEAAYDAIVVTLEKARQARAVTVAKIASPVPHVPEVDVGLSDGLAALNKLCEQGHWSELRTQVAELDRTADRLLAQARAALRAVVEPLDQRDELRGRLAAYQTMAGNQGRAEDPHLDELYRQARDILWAAPCNLLDGEAATMRYIRAIQEE
jgi:hypothetical protein